MKAKKITYFEDSGIFVGWFEDFPDYKTQGRSLKELHDNLKDIDSLIKDGTLACIQQSSEVRVA